VFECNFFALTLVVPSSYIADAFGTRVSFSIGANDVDHFKDSLAASLACIAVDQVELVFLHHSSGIQVLLRQLNLTDRGIVSILGCRRHPVIGDIQLSYIVVAMTDVRLIKHGILLRIALPRYV